MCLILDANKFGSFFDQENVSMQPVRDWHNKGKNSFVCSLTKKLRKELASDSRMEKSFPEWVSNGKMLIVNKQEVEEEEINLKNSSSITLKSDDGHIIALARVAKVKLLISADQDLHEDFKSIVKGSIYQDESHKHLLKPCIPKS